MLKVLIIYFLALWIQINDNYVEGHGMMLEPVARESRWRFNSSAPINKNDSAIWCGSYKIQWKTNDGKCGVCGDDFRLPQPRPNENGGEFGQGIIVRNYTAGDIIKVAANLTVNHQGDFHYEICNLDKELETDACFESNRLPFADGSGMNFSIETKTPGWFNNTIKLPDDLTCEHCVLRWKYQGSDQVGKCENESERAGCGPQQSFYSCADITIQK